MTNPTEIAKAAAAGAAAGAAQASEAAETTEYERKVAGRAQGLTRRGFLTGAGALAAVLAGAGLAGCSQPSSGSSNSGGSQGGAEGAAGETAVSAADIQWDEEYDVVVVGSGLAGTATACTVAQEGNGATCLLLEKGASGIGGGNSPFSGGAVLWTSPEQKSDYITYMKALRGTFQTPSDEIIEVYSEGITHMEEFFRACGAGDDDMLFMPAGTTPGWPEYPEFDGSASACCMYASGQFTHPTQIPFAYVEAHPDVITQKLNSPLTDLVFDPETKAVIGVVYSDNGKERKARAVKGVVMCCGGFESDEFMMENYLSVANAHPLAGVNNTGDGHRICMKYGADFWHMASVAGFWNGAEKIDGSQHGVWYSLQKQYGITVAINGRRYVWDVDYVGLPAQNPSDSASLTMSARHGHQNYAGEWPHTPLPERSWFVFDQANYTNATTPMHGGYYGSLFESDPVAEGWAVKADTIEELAGKMGVPADELALTVQVWNESCERGVDIQFHRDPEHLTPITEPPFYAIAMAPEFVNTDGGPVRNEKAQVLDVEGKPIPNLYSAGEFGSIWSNMYQGGGNLSECIVFGRIAARQALGL